MLKKIATNDENDNFFDEIFELFVVSKTANGVSDATLRNYHYHKKAISKYLDTNRPMSEISKRDLERMIVDMKKAGIKHNSIATYVRFLRTLFNWCESEDIAVPKLKNLKEKEVVKETYTDEELERLLRKPKKGCVFGRYRSWVIINFLLNSGCRAATARNIKNKDVDLNGMRVVFSHNKSGKIQTIPLCSIMASILLTPDLYEIDPVSGFVVTGILLRTLQTEDDGTAMFLLTVGQAILRVMEEPLRVQNYLRNIMEITFDGTAGSTSAEQYEKLKVSYADIARICDPARLPRQEEYLSIRLHNLMELWILVLALYFEQDNQRICRCDYCWGYFIPKTKKATRYCDRVTDGQSCKQRGANLARLDKPSEDEAFLIYEKLLDRMYSRLLRWQDAAPTERSNLTPMDYEQYDQWSENARLAREEYVQGKLTAEEFLRKVDTTHELTSYEVDKIDLPDGPSRWQQLVAGDFRFDPERYFPGKMAHLNLSDPDPQWQILTADDLRREAQKGHQSLKEKYGK